MTHPDTVSIRLLGPESARPEVLSAAESVRLAGFVHEARRVGFVLGRTAARSLIADALGCEPEAAPLTVAEDGAPDVLGAPLYVSIAHAGTALGGAALAPNPVGLDLETIRPRQPDLWRRILAPDEHDVLDALGGPTDEVQTLLWSLKESVLKARRTGLRAGTRSVRLVHLDLNRRQVAATDEDGGAWSLGYKRRGDLWISWAVASE